jgi:hypothetical protein
MLKLAYYGNLEWNPEHSIPKVCNGFITFQLSSLVLDTIVKLGIGRHPRSPSLGRRVFQLYLALQLVVRGRVEILVCLRFLRDYREFLVDRPVPLFQLSTTTLELS